MRVISVVTAAAISLSATTALAAEGVGKIMAVIDSARASGQVGERTLAVGSKVFIGDVVATDADGETQLLFDDGSRMVVGPNSALKIDEFVFRGNSAEDRFVVSALGGSFRFISGEIGADAYLIRTPSAIISVGGTAFDFTVISTVTKLVLLKGAATLCEEVGRCRTIATKCGLLQTATGQGVEKISVGKRWFKETLGNFPWLTSQSSLLEGFQIADLGCLLGRPVATIPGAPPAEPRGNQGGTTGNGTTGNGTTGNGTTGNGTTSSNGGGQSRSGLGDGSNPGRGSGRSNAGGRGGEGTGNPSDK